MPILRQHDVIEARGEPVDRRHDFVAVRDRERAARHEIVLHVDHEKDIVGALHRGAPSMGLGRAAARHALKPRPLFASSTIDGAICHASPFARCA